MNVLKKEKDMQANVINEQEMEIERYKVALHDAIEIIRKLVELI